MDLPEDLQKQNIMSLNLRLIQACGYLRKDSASTKWVFVFCMDTIKYSIVLLFLSFLVGASVEMYRSRNTTHDLGETVVFIITIIKSMVKLVSLIRNKTEYLHLIHSFNDIYIHGTPLTAEQLSVLKSYLSQASKLIKCIWYPSTIMTFAFLGKVTPPDDRDREFVPAWESSSRVTIPFQTADSPFYIVRATYATAVTVLGYFVTTMVNTFGFLLVIYTTAQFAHLAETLRNAAENVLEMIGKAEGVSTFGGVIKDLSEVRRLSLKDNRLDTTQRVRTQRRRKQNYDTSDAEEKMTVSEEEEFGNDAEDRFDEEMHKYLNQCIKHHQKLLKNAEILNQLLRPLMFSQILCAGILIGVMGYSLTSPKSTSDFVHAAGYVTHLLTETGIICWLASGLITQADMVGEAAYFCDWYNEPVSFQRSIIIMMARTKHPVQVSLQPLGILSLEMFGTILNSSYTYFTIMRKMTN